jgi:hypothetical protein
MDEKTAKDKTLGPTETDSQNVPSPYNPNRHERRFIYKQYAKQYGKESLKVFKAEYKKAVAEAKGEGKV